jgi:tetratricopeptide (TPR) repeat protein
VPESTNNRPNSNVRSHHAEDPTFGISRKELVRLAGEAAFWFSSLAVILAPLLHGATTVFSQGPLMILVMLAALCWILRLALISEARAVFSLVGGPVVVLATYVVVRYTLAAETESIARPDMMLATMAGLLFFLLLNNIRHRWQVTFLAIMWTGLGTVEALYGFFQSVSGEVATGTFVTTQDFSVYLQLAIAVALSKFLFSRHELRHKIGFALCAILMTFVLVLCGAHPFWSGTVASLAVISFYLIRRRSWRFRWAAMGLCVFLTVVVTGLIGFYTLHRQESAVRVPNTSASASDKSGGWPIPPLWKSAIAIGQHNLLMGAGPRMFRWVFSTQRRVQSNPQSPGNAYLEVFAEYGTAGYLLLLWLLVSFIIAIVQILKLRADRYSSSTLSNRYAMALASFAGVAAVAVDACFDFNPRTAGTLLNLVALMAAGLTCGVQHHGKTDQVIYHPGKHSTLRLTGITRWVIIASVVVFVILLGSRLEKSYPSSWLMRLGRQQHALLNWNGAAARYRQAWSFDRRSFDATCALGDLFCARATWSSNQRAENVVEAIQWYERALVLNPYAYDILISEGRLYDLTGQRQQAFSAFQRAVQADPNNAEYYVALGLHRDRWGEPGKAADCFNTARELTATYGVLP